MFEARFYGPHDFRNCQSEEHFQIFWKNGERAGTWNGDYLHCSNDLERALQQCLIFPKLPRGVESAEALQQQISDNWPEHVVLRPAIISQAVAAVKVVGKFEDYETHIIFELEAATQCWAFSEPLGLSDYWLFTFEDHWVVLNWYSTA